MKRHFFHRDSNYYPFRWFIVLAIGIVTVLAYADYTGLRVFSFSGQQHWSASGPSGHK